MEHQQAAETPNENSVETNVIPLRDPARRTRRVAPLSDDEILALRDWLNSRARDEFEQIKANCQIAQRILSTR